jgi:hypothetical protein
VLLCFSKRGPLDLQIFTFFKPRGKIQLNDLTRAVNFRATTLEGGLKGGDSDSEDKSGSVQE